MPKFACCANSYNYNIVSAIETRLGRYVVRTLSCAFNLHDNRISNLRRVIVKIMKKSIFDRFVLHTIGHSRKSYRLFSIILLECTAKPI